MGLLLTFTPPLKQLAHRELRAARAELVSAALASLTLLERLFLSTRIGRGAR